ncbi:MAG: DNA-directed RNA polymerase subunit beta [Candidatus Hydrothermales bacterium]
MIRERIGSKKEILPIPDLLKIQISSYKEFLQEDVEPDKRKNIGLESLFREFFPVEDPGKKFLLEYVSYRVENPRFKPEECIQKNLTYSAPVYVKFRLKEIDSDSEKPKKIKEEEVFFLDLPLMTDKGTFIVNGIERVIVNQLHRSPGVYFNIDQEEGKYKYIALFVPYRGPWIEFSIDSQKVFGVTILKRRRFPVTRILRAMGYETNSDILRLFFGEPEVKPLKSIEPEIFILAEEITGPQGELLYDTLDLVTERVIAGLQAAGYKDVKVYNLAIPGLDVIITTIRHDRAKTRPDALSAIYRLLKYIPPPSLDEAEEFFNETFFSRVRMELGAVGRYKLNTRLGLNIDENIHELTKDDLTKIFKKLLDLYNGNEKPDDIDHLENRRVRRVGELLTNHLRMAFMKLNRNIKEKFLAERDQILTPRQLINPKIIANLLKSFFTVNRLSQFLDQTNPLAELTHKRRLSALGPGGLTRETAGFEVRDVHPSHYGRLCPIETPEGQNIGLIASLTTYAEVDDYGFIKTPLRKVIKGKITDKIVYMTPVEEKNYKIAPADVEINEKGEIVPDLVPVRFGGGYPTVKKEEVDFIDVSPRQLVSPSASLIPFLEHDDANRALMGSNMQRQAVPLIEPEAPLVGTGMERKIAYDTGMVILAKRDGTVLEADARKIVIKPDKSEDTDSFWGEALDIYYLTNFKKTNQETILHHRVRVKPGDKVKAGDLLADNAATDMGELSLGKNLLVAFIPWYGYNFEDAIVVSERLLKDDVFTSIHIKELELTVRETKLGPEEVTRDIPNISEEALKNLDEYGVVRIGAEVSPDDIVIGKVSPKGEKEYSPEDKLIQAIFEHKAREVKDSSLRVPPGVQGVVVDVVILTRNFDHPLAKKIIRERRMVLEEEFMKKREKIIYSYRDKLMKLLMGKKTEISLRNKRGKILLRKGSTFNEEFFRGTRYLDVVFEEGFLGQKKLEKEIIDLSNKLNEKIDEIQKEYQARKQLVEIGDELPHGVNMLIKVYVAQKRELKVGDKLAGRHGNKGVIAKIAPVEDMPFLEDGTPVDIVLNPLGVPSRMNVGQVLETILGWASKKKNVYYSCPVFEGMTLEQIEKELKDAGLPLNGRVKVRDGRTGEELRNEVTVGYIYMMKLVHMVEDKIHARAVGPYSMITQQPLGGKARFGGQRFGEMEVWALEAYGASYTLQEILTVKSDDVKGRNRLYQAVIRGEEAPEPSLPVSFDVLLNELRGLCLDVEIEKEKI